MTDLVGGFRNRLIIDSVQYCLENALTELGWFDSGRAHRPLRFLHEPTPWNEATEPNAIGVAMWPSFEQETELGSNLHTDFHLVKVETWAESTSLADHLTGDLVEIIRGRLGGRTRPSISVLDFSLATPAPVFNLDVDTDSIEVIRNAGRMERVWQTFWTTVAFVAIDTYDLT